jgi:CNT family concentrative nucleoside transporter
MEKLISLLGLFVMVTIAYGLSVNRKKVQWRTVWGGIIAQIIFGFLILKTRIGLFIFEQARDSFQAILNFTSEGSKFYLVL